MSAPTLEVERSSAPATTDFVVRLLVGDDARTWLADQRAVDAWQSLYEQCPWRTVFQGPAFVTTWYRVYRSCYEPLIVAGLDCHGVLVGLLPAAKSVRDGSLVIAGANQAEYQGWLAIPAHGGAFIQEALEALSPRQMGEPLTFTYLPPGAPDGRLRGDGNLPARCEFHGCRRPAISLEDREQFAAYLRKHRSRQSMRRLSNRLKRGGEMQFVRLDQEAQLQAILPTLTAYHDVRHLAVHDNAPFFDDPLKATFFRELHRLPGVLHATALFQNERFITAHVGFNSLRTVHLGVTVYSPWHSQNGPFGMHLLMLLEALATEDFLALDLTAGESAWKDQFAMSHDVVHVLTVYPSRSARHRAIWRSRARDFAKSAVDRCLGRAVTAGMRRFVQESESGGMFAALRRAFARLVRNVWSSREVRVCQAVTPIMDTEEPCFARNQLDDFLRLDPAGARDERQALLRDLLSAAEHGATVYTYVEDERLLAFGWWFDAANGRAGAEPALPEDAVLIDRLWAAPIPQAKALMQSCLTQMLADARRVTNAQSFYLCVPAEKTALCQVVERCGFNHEYSLWERTILFRTARWRSNGASKRPALNQTTCAID